MTADNRKALWAAAREHAEAQTDDERLAKLVALEHVVECIVHDALSRRRDAELREDSMGGWR